MIDHCSLSVYDIDVSLPFYEKSLAELGAEKIHHFAHEGMSLVAFGINNNPSFWISHNKHDDVHNNGMVPTLHGMVAINQIKGYDRGMSVVFKAASADQVRRWHTACVEHGGTSEEEPKAHPDYHPGYFGAVVVDPNGWRIEACTHDYMPEN